LFVLFVCGRLCWLLASFLNVCETSVHYYNMMCYTCDVLCVFTVIVKTAKQCIVYGYGTTCPEIQESMERSQNTEYHVYQSRTRGVQVKL